jgi:hypothetical protein
MQMRIRMIAGDGLSHQPVVLFSHNKPATSNQPAVHFSQNKPAPAISHQPTEQAEYPSSPTACLISYFNSDFNSLFISLTSSFIARDVSQHVLFHNLLLKY